MSKLAVSDLLAKAIQRYRDTNSEKTGLLAETLVDLKLTPEEEARVIQRIEELSHTLMEGIDLVIREASPNESIVPGVIEVDKLEKAG